MSSIREWLVLALLCLFPAQAMAGGISLLSATYGGNCGASASNADKDVEKICNGADICQYKVNTKILGDPARGCGKDFVVKWTCPGSPETLSVKIPPEAGAGHVALLDCSAAWKSGLSAASNLGDPRNIGIPPRPPQISLTAPIDPPPCTSEIVAREPFSNVVTFTDFYIAQDDFADALCWALEGATTGNALEEFHVGTMFDSPNQGTRVSYPEAEEFLTAAAGQGEFSAYKSLVYLYGLNVLPDSKNKLAAVITKGQAYAAKLNALCKSDAFVAGYLKVLNLFDHSSDVQLAGMAALLFGVAGGVDKIAYMDAAAAIAYDDNHFVCEAEVKETLKANYVGAVGTDLGPRGEETRQQIGAVGRQVANATNGAVRSFMQYFEIEKLSGGKYDMVMRSVANHLQKQPL